ncbi:hypothetical protein NOVO_06915 [Rickettsiales bacterium Ac37b]|nr:hypothetical protein NOVO_06915 [Rickettsiales bacterium Ac37b]
MANDMPNLEKMEIELGDYRQEDFPVTDTYEEDFSEDNKNIPADFLDSLENDSGDIKPLKGAYQEIAKLSILNKITAENSIINAKVGQSVNFKNFKIIPVLCWKSSVNDESKVLLDISDENVEEQKKIFYGWMLAHKPSVVTFEHPVYDITILECAMAANKDEDDKK